jgi:hypothetical protein
LPTVQTKRIARSPKAGLSERTRASANALAIQSYSLDGRHLTQPDLLGSLHHAHEQDSRPQDFGVRHLRSMQCDLSWAQLQRGRKPGHAANTLAPAIDRA